MHAPPSTESLSPRAGWVVELRRDLALAARALGRRIRTSEESVPNARLGEWRRVVGVARDVRQTYQDEDRRDLYLPFLQTPTRFANVQLRIDRPAAVPPAQLAKIVAELDPFVRVQEPRLLTSEDRQFARARFMTLLMTSFAGFGTALALLGLYGVTAYTVQQREREIAIRMAVGASPGGVIRMFIRHGGLAIAIGLAAGAWGASAVGRILESQIYGVPSFDLPSVLLGAGLLLACGLIATWWPARRAANADLVRVLKEE